MYFFLVVTRGVLGIATFSNVSIFPGETQAGAAMCVEELPRLGGEQMGGGQMGVGLQGSK